MTGWMCCRRISPIAISTCSLMGATDGTIVADEPAARGAVWHVVPRLPAGYLAVIGKRAAVRGCGGRPPVADPVVSSDARAAAGVCCRGRVDGREAAAVFFDG